MGATQARSDTYRPGEALIKFCAALGRPASIAEIAGTVSSILANLADDKIRRPPTELRQSHRRVPFTKLAKSVWNGTVDLAIKPDLPELIRPHRGARNSTECISKSGVTNF
jgi:hypothetical protein